MKNTIVVILLILFTYFNNLSASEKIDNISFSDVIKQIKNIGNTDWKNKYPQIYNSSELFKLKFIINSNIEGFERFDYNNYEEYQKSYTHYIGRINNELNMLNEQTEGRISHLDEIIALQQLLKYDFYTVKNIEVLQNTCNNISNKLIDCKNSIKRIKLDSNIHADLSYVNQLSSFIKELNKIKNKLLEYQKNTCNDLKLDERIQCLKKRIEEVKSYYKVSMFMISTNNINSINKSWIDNEFKTTLETLETLLSSEQKKLLQYQAKLEKEKQEELEKEKNNLFIMFIIAGLLIVTFIILYIKIQNWKKNRPKCSLCESYNLELSMGELNSMGYDHKRKNGKIDSRFDNNWKHEIYQGIIHCLDCNHQKDIGTISIDTKYSKGQETNEQKADFGKYQAYFHFDGTKKNGPFS